MTFSGNFSVVCQLEFPRAMQIKLFEKPANRLMILTWNVGLCISFWYGGVCDENVMLGNKIYVQILSCKIIHVKARAGKHDRI